MVRQSNTRCSTRKTVGGGASGTTRASVVENPAVAPAQFFDVMTRTRTNTVSRWRVTCAMVLLPPLFAVAPPMASTTISVPNSTAAGGGGGT